MSGGPIHIGISDESPAARIRPEARAFASRHSGGDMSAVFKMTNQPRPSTAPVRRSASGPLPGFENEIVGTQLATVPRVKPEASEIARRSQGQMGSILAQGQPRPRVYVSSSLEDCRPKTAPVRKGPIVNEPLIEIIQARVKPEAAAVAELGHTGLVGRLFADSMDEARRKNIENSLKEKVIPKNHIQQNIQRMRKMQKESREKRSQVTSPTPVKALWRSEKYSNVESRVGGTHKTWQKKPTPNAPRPNTAPSNSQNEVIKRKENFIAKNARNAWKQENKLKRSKSSEDLRRAIDAKNKQQNMYDLEIRGTVPDYLVKRKEKWAEQKKEEEKRKPDPDCPKGHKRVPEEERRKVLEKLKKSQKEYEDELLALPVRQCDTLKYKQRKMELEGKLTEIDEAIKIFSKKKVFVRCS